MSDLTLEANIDYGFEPGSGDCMLHDMGVICWREIRATLGGPHNFKIQCFVR